MPCHGFFLHISIHKSIEYLEGDICDPSLVSKIFLGLDSVFHEAVLMPVPLSCEKLAKPRINCMEVGGEKLVIYLRQAVIGTIPSFQSLKICSVACFIIHDIYSLPVHLDLNYSLFALTLLILSMSFICRLFYS